MSIQEAVASFALAAAVALAACSGGDGMSSAATSTVEATTSTVEATTSTVEATTTTVRTSTSFPYEIAPMDVAPYDPETEWAWASDDPVSQHGPMYDFNNEYYIPVPDDGTYPIDGRNPLYPDALTLREFSELPSGAQICGTERRCLGGAAVCIRRQSEDLSA
ncbi:MAG: hypothetical protein Q7V57_19700 [Actinomycetota bacterium]|nr:hypothetical protein [Actinomycetota bacterium]